MINFLNYMPKSEATVLRGLQKDPQTAQAFSFIAERVNDCFRKCPKFYATENESDPVAYLHYCRGSYDAYITEIQNGEAFGYASFGGEFEAGYLNIEEFINNNIELDLYFMPQPVSGLINNTIFEE